MVGGLFVLEFCLYLIDFGGIVMVVCYLVLKVVFIWSYIMVVICEFWVWFCEGFDKFFVYVCYVNIFEYKLGNFFCSLVEFGYNIFGDYVSWFRDVNWVFVFVVLFLGNLLFWEWILMWFWMFVFVFYDWICLCIVIKKV